MSFFVETNGIRLHYLDHPGDGPTLLLVPGLTANCHVFDGLVAAGLGQSLRVLVPDMRGRGSAPLLYDPGFAAIQAKGYPGLTGKNLPVAPAAAFAAALAAAKAQGWTIVASDAAAGRIEATDTVPWWGFKDDVVIRLTPDGTSGSGGTRVDVRSKSRVGKGDLGVNARRISDFLEALKA